ncbi:MAG: disulfide bond formation protein DsbA [Comamonas sp. SCN 65-56]|uniref:DsbA family oxidoreductase n=1 Tax=Comamonas sp. SCN 65-56 TaxID=1660095 RepID=UPI000869B499|nr:DsbA family oxidoreductase [Comamonas sp. SCN 65-56]ODS92756.1 MAG: disulfide bond formation protein DsbA [Comamonas sp. SCN 65-56]
MPATPVTLKIDFVSDVVCPWCAVGLHALERAAEALKDEVVLEWHFRPFELNPGMAPEGQDMAEHLHEKYGSTPGQQAQMRELITARGAEVGFTFHLDQRSRTWNTFDAHRLLHWLGEEGQDGQQRALKHALLAAYFTEGRNPSDHAVLLAIVARLGLDQARAAAILASDEYADAVRAEEAHYQRLGIRSVPSIILNDRHLISGGQPVEVFEQALRQVAAQAQ